MASRNVEKLYEAISSGDVDSIRTMLGVEPALANSKEATPPPLHFAIWDDQIGALETMLTFDPDLELTDQDRDATPLDYAIVYCRKAMIPALIEHGANTKGRLATAQKGARGGFEEFEELPSRETYSEIVEQLQSLGVSS